jgi:hypothetical protein
MRTVVTNIRVGNKFWTLEFWYTAGSHKAMPENEDGKNPNKADSKMEIHNVM